MSCFCVLVSFIVLIVSCFLFLDYCSLCYLSRLLLQVTFCFVFFCVWSVLCVGCAVSWIVVWWSLLVVRCALCYAGCVLCVACCLLRNVCCLLFLAWCLAFGVWCIVYGVLRFRFVVCCFVVCRLLFVVL